MLLWAWFVVTIVWWAAVCILFYLGSSPPLVSWWWCLIAAFGLMAWCWWSSLQPILCVSARRRALELSMAVCVVVSLTTAMFAMSLGALFFWFLSGAAAFVLALVAMIRARRHPLRSLGLMAGYGAVLVLSFPIASEPVRDLGLKVKVTLVQSEYRTAAEALLLTDDVASTRGGPVSELRVEPQSGRVVVGADGDPGMVVWTWTSGLAGGKPSGLVYDPGERFGEVGEFYAPPPDGMRLRDCEPVFGEWWWCVLYD